MRLLSHSPLSSSRTVDPSLLALGRSISCARSEWEAMVVGDRHTTVFFWLQLSLKRLADKGALTQEAFSQCCAPAITSMRAQANDLMSSLDRDTPFPYIALAGVLVQVNLPHRAGWVAGAPWARARRAGGRPERGEAHTASACAGGSPQGSKGGARRPTASRAS